jgi:hypothetical protein
MAAWQKGYGAVTSQRYAAEETSRFSATEPHSLEYSARNEL